MPAPDENTRKRQGQTLAEFALTLPILLILVFGVIEFGRVFQAWVTLQNSARTAARYASTGSYNEVRWPLIDDGRNDPDSVVPCVFDLEYGDTRGTRNTSYFPNGPGTFPEVQRYERPGADDAGDESLFATWWDGRNCEPNLPEDQNARKDIVRILSIMEEARRGASGLALGPDILEGVNTTDDVKNVLYSVWDRSVDSGTKMAGWDTPAWFNVMVCSSRQPIGENSTLVDRDSQTRFRTIVDESIGVSGDIYAPVCLMNEIASTVDNPDALENGGVPWLDPGNAGDSVTIVVTFNHPLVTPLGLAPYVQLQARRTAVNEAFRVVDARSALLGGGRVGEDLNRPPIADAGPDQALMTDPTSPTNPNAIVVTLDGTDSYDPDGSITLYTWINAGTNEQVYSGTNPRAAVTLAPGNYIFWLYVRDDGNPALESERDAVRIIVEAPEPTSTATATITATATSTQVPPFSCDLLTAGDLTLFGNRASIEFRNDNVLDTVLTRADLHWRKPALYPGIYVSSMALDSNIIWSGQDANPSTDTNADPSTPLNVFINSERILSGLSSVVFEAVFANGPGSLSSVMSIYDFAGTAFYFSNPENAGEICTIPLVLPTPTPSPTVDPVRPTNTATFTPDCAGEGVSVRLTEFRNFGVVRLEVVNRWQTVAVMSDMSVSWVQRAPGIMMLEQVTVGGNGPADTFTPTVRVWQAPSGQDVNPPTLRGDGAWLTNYTFPPNSITPMYLDFGGTTTTIQSSFGVQPSDFNGTWFEIQCVLNPTGGTGPGGGNPPSGRISLVEENTPAPTNTPGPTNTPRPTFTPSMTFTPRPTNTQGPPPTPTNTRQPTNTPPPPPSATNTPWPTQPGAGGSD